MPYQSLTIKSDDNVYAYAFQDTKGETLVNFMISADEGGASLHLTFPFEMVLDLAAKAANAVAADAQYQARQAELEQAAKDALDKAADAVYGEQVPA